jgi:hypothetical protein
VAQYDFAFAPTEILKGGLASQANAVIQSWVKEKAREGLVSGSFDWIAQLNRSFAEDTPAHRNFD